MLPYAAEFLGTAILVLLGNGVVANVLLAKTKGHNSGWIVIAFGWGMAVFVAVQCVQDISDAHINPAVTIGLAVAGKFARDQVAAYILAQLLGGFFGAVLVFFFYRDHYHETQDADAKLATFCTAPSLRNRPRNLLCEAIGTFVLVFAVLTAGEASVDWQPDAPAGDNGSAKIGLGALGALPVGLVVLAIGLSLGGTTGYAINPARDLGPRIAHARLPVPCRRDSDWSYAWVPVAGPILGALAAAFVFGLTATG